MKPLTNNTLNLEFNIPDNSWFITITLNPQFYRRRAHYQYKAIVEPVKTILKSFCKEFTVIPELTKAGNIHLHGYIVFTDEELEIIEYRKIHLLDKLKIIGMSKINNEKIQEKVRTTAYMTKSIEETNAIINKCISNDPLKLIISYKRKHKMPDICKSENKEQSNEQSINQPQRIIKESLIVRFDD